MNTESNLKLKFQFVQRNEFVTGNGIFIGLQISAVVMEQIMNVIRKNRLQSDKEGQCMSCK